MINISKFIKNHLPLCVCTLGLAIVGYLGYHAVRWIIHKCQKTEKVDQIAQEIINNSAPTSSKPLTDRVFNVEISPDKITMGQGEYIVFHKLPNGEKKSLSPETFEKVYKVLLQYIPAAMEKKSSEKGEEYTNRYELLKSKLKEIDPTLEAVFVPRTLYELIFIRKCIQEDLKHKKICPDLDPSSHKIIQRFKNNVSKLQAYLKEQKEEQLKRKCWHLCYFDDMGDNHHDGVKNVVYRLNKAMLKAFDPPSECFTYQELSVFVEKEIDFLKNHYKKNLEVVEKSDKDEQIEDISSCNTPGPTTNFGFESTKGSIKPMGIRNESDAQIIRDAIALECSKIAQHSLFLYRGADFKNDSIFCWNEKDKPYSLSYGSSLFAGCLFDGGATAFHYMRNGKNAYAIPVSFNQLDHSPFFVPTTHSVAQLFGDGEIFHARTKAWKDYDVTNLGGMNLGTNGRKRDHLKSSLSKEELNTQFEAYKNKAFQLK